MKKQIYVGVFVVAIIAAVGMVASESLLNRGRAQDRGKTAEPEKSKTDDVFDRLKKDLDAKKDAPPPSLPLPTPAKETLTLPPLPSKDPVALPADQKLVFPPLPSVGAKPAVVDQIPLPAAVTDKPLTPEPKLDPPPVKPAPSSDVKPLPPLTTDPVKPPQAVKPMEPMLPPSKPMAPPPSYPPITSAPPIAQELAKVKDCKWSLQIEVVAGRTIVVATVNKRHEFKIICNNLDLQTGKGTLKATGKVEISGDTVNGSCENLSIPLLDDRLVLEGSAELRIQRTSANVSDTRSAFELKGDTLNLRVTDLAPANLRQAVWAPGDAVEVRQAASPPATDSKKWTSYGKLVRVENKVAPALQLQNRAGTTIAYIEARAGGTLDQYLGQNISVFGATEEHIQNVPVIRVTHIALP